MKGLAVAYVDWNTPVMLWAAILDLAFQAMSLIGGTILAKSFLVLDAGVFVAAVSGD